MRGGLSAKLAIGLVAFSWFSASAHAAAITPGNLVVVRVGSGSGALSSNAAATFVHEYTPAGALQQTLAMPTSASGSQLALTLSGTAISEGFIKLSSNGQYLTLGGYNATPGATAIVAGNRVAGRIGIDGSIDTSTNLQDNTSNIRSVVSTDGTTIWATSNTGGVRYTAFAAAAPSTQLNTAEPLNVRVLDIHKGQLYASASAGSFQGVGTVGAGLPESAGQTLTLLSGFPTASGPSAFDFFFANDQTLYVADGRAVASGGGLQKWVRSGESWTLAYTLSTSLPGGLRGLGGVVDESGTAALYATTALSSGNTLVRVTDVVAGTTLPVHTFTTLATAPANTAFRGVALTAVPEPAALAPPAIGGIALLARRRRR